MHCGAPLLGRRVAPRCTAADALLVVSVTRGRVAGQDLFPEEIADVFDLVEAIQRHRLDTLICGGISADVRDTVHSLDVEVIDNVACTAEAIVPAIENGVLTPGYGLSTSSGTPLPVSGTEETQGKVDPRIIDCLGCRNKICLAGENCLNVSLGGDIEPPPESLRMIETAFDLSQEQERQLCRVAEMVYFCLEMNYRHIGVAFCTELLEPARILTGVLRRFFEVTPVCCKVGGATLEGIPGNEGAAFQAVSDTACNPLAQAEILNLRKTDFNLIVGLCVGSDAAFARASQAPASALIVKDRSLANNPVGALYSDYYLRESVTPAPGRSPARSAKNSFRIKEKT